jgi:hypothetical protein
MKVLSGGTLYACSNITLGFKTIADLVTEGYTYNAMFCVVTYQNEVYFQL